MNIISIRIKNIIKLSVSMICPLICLLSIAPGTNSGAFQCTNRRFNSSITSSPNLRSYSNIRLINDSSINDSSILLATTLSEDAYQILQYSKNPFSHYIPLENEIVYLWTDPQGNISPKFTKSIHEIAQVFEGTHFEDFCEKFLQAIFARGLIAGVLQGVSTKNNTSLTPELISHTINAIQLYLQSIKPVSFDQILMPLLTNSINIQSENSENNIGTPELSPIELQTPWKHALKLRSLIAQADKITLAPYISIHQSIIEILDHYREKAPRYSHIIKSANNPNLAGTNLYPVRWLKNFDTQLAIDLFQTWPQIAAISELAKYMSVSGNHEKLQLVADQLSTKLKTNPEYIDIIDALFAIEPLSAHKTFDSTAPNSTAFNTQNNRFIPSSWKNSFNGNVIIQLCCYPVGNFKNMLGALISYIINHKIDGRKIIQRALDDLANDNNNKNNIGKYTKHLNVWCAAAGVDGFQPNTGTSCVVQ